MLRTQSHCRFYLPKSENLYRMHFIRGVNNTITDFDEKAFIDTLVYISSGATVQVKIVLRISKLRCKWP